jgi:uncharacterized membrane protein YgaE (UPF0421/DUF939 family)
MYIFLAVAAIYSFYLFHSKYLLRLYQNEVNDDNINEYENDDEKEKIDLEPTEVQSEINKLNQTVVDNDEFIEEKQKGWFW